MWFRIPGFRVESSGVGRWHRSGHGFSPELKSTQGEPNLPRRRLVSLWRVLRGSVGLCGGLGFKEIMHNDDNAVTSIPEGVNARGYCLN